MRSKLTYKAGGKTSSIVINHEEDWWGVMKNNKTLRLSASKNDFNNSFLSEEEYFGYVTLETPNHKIGLKQVRRTNVNHAGDRVNVALGFIELEGGPD